MFSTIPAVVIDTTFVRVINYSVFTTRIRERDTITNVYHVGIKVLFFAIHSMPNVLLALRNFYRKPVIVADHKSVFKS